jgi:hypothetical protein
MQRGVVALASTMDQDVVVEDALVAVLEKAAEVTERLSREKLTVEEDAAALAEATAQFAGLVKTMHGVLDARMVATLGDDVPLRNHSYKEREELELAVVKAKYLLQQLP